MSTVKAVRAEPENEFTTTHHVYVPHRAGLPPLPAYIRELWRRREFAAELSKSTMRAANSDTLFGQIWLVLNPLMLAAVYFVLVDILSGRSKGWDYFAHLTGGLFAFYFVSGSMSTGAQSVTAGGKLLMNTAFPRLLMPLSAVRTAFFRFLPTIPIYAIFHLLAGSPLRWQTLAAVPFMGMLVLFSAGLASLFATLQVYFRDTASFLPYIIRIWLYLSPVILTVELLEKSKLYQFVKWNPLFPILGGYTEALTEGRVPAAALWVEGGVASVVVFVAGSLFFMSREREFAVRI